MPYFVVINEQGPQWDEKRSMRDQEGWTEHAVFMDALADERFVLLGGGPLKYSKHRAILVLNAPNGLVVRKRLAEDPWMRTGVLRTMEIYSWEVLLWKANLNARIAALFTRKGVKGFPFSTTRPRQGGCYYSIRIMEKPDVLKQC